MAVKGVFTSDQGIAGEKVGDFASALLTLMPTGSAPLLALTSGMESVGATDIVVTWFEEHHQPGRETVVGNVDNTSQTITVGDGSMYVPGTIMLVESTGEHIFLLNVVGNTLTAQRGFAGTTAANIGNGAHLQRLGTAFEEASERPVAVVPLGTPRFNYVQIFRNAWDVSGTTRAVNYRTGSKVERSKQFAAMQHAEDIEKSCIWGRKMIGTQNGHPFRTMDGINTQIQTNVTIAPASLTWRDVNDFLMGVFAKNVKGKPNERIAFTGNGAIATLNDVAAHNAQIKIEPGETEFGLAINKWITPFGVITLMTHPLMSESPFWTNDIYVYHPGVIRTRYLRKTFNDDYDQNGTRAGRDADFGVVTTEMCIEYRAEQTGGLLLQLQDAA